jgi:hypothetical protein
MDANERDGIECVDGGNGNNLRRRRTYEGLMKERNMKRAVCIAFALALGIASASAQETCESKAVDKNGQALAGAAKTSFVQKCKRDACEAKAIDKNGKKLSGAAKNSFMTKCEKEA